MAFRHGSKAVVTVAGTDISAFTDNAELSISPETAQTTGFGSTWHSNIGGLLGATFSLSGSYDPTAVTGPAAVMTAAYLTQAIVAVVFKPGGSPTGQRQDAFNALVTSYSETSTIDDKIAWAAEFMVDGAVTVTTL